MVSLNSDETNLSLSSIPSTSSLLPPPKFKPSSTSNRTNISLKRTYSNNTFDEAQVLNEEELSVKEPSPKKRLISPELISKTLTNSNNNYNELEIYYNSICLELKENDQDWNEYFKRERRDFLERLVNGKTYSTRLGSIEAIREKVIALRTDQSEMTGIAFPLPPPLSTIITNSNSSHNNNVTIITTPSIPTSPTFRIKDEDDEIDQLDEDQDSASVTAALLRPLPYAVSPPPPQVRTEISSCEPAVITQPISDIVMTPVLPVVAVVVKTNGIRLPKQNVTTITTPQLPALNPTASNSTRATSTPTSDAIPISCVWGSKVIPSLPEHRISPFVNVPSPQIPISTVASTSTTSVSNAVASGSGSTSRVTHQGQHGVLPPLNPLMEIDRRRTEDIEKARKTQEYYQRASEARAIQSSASSSNGSKSTPPIQNQNRQRPNSSSSSAQPPPSNSVPSQRPTTTYVASQPAPAPSRQESDRQQRVASNTSALQHQQPQIVAQEKFKQQQFQQQQRQSDAVALALKQQQLHQQKQEQQQQEGLQLQYRQQQQFAEQQKQEFLQQQYTKEHNRQRQQQQSQQQPQPQQQQLQIAHPGTTSLPVPKIPSSHTVLEPRFLNQIYKIIDDLGEPETFKRFQFLGVENCWFLATHEGYLKACAIFAYILMNRGNTGSDQSQVVLNQQFQPRASGSNYQQQSPSLANNSNFELSELQHQELVLKAQNANMEVHFSHQQRLQAEHDSKLRSHLLSQQHQQQQQQQQQQIRQQQILQHQQMQAQAQANSIPGYVSNQAYPSQSQSSHQQQQQQQQSYRQPSLSRSHPASTQNSPMLHSNAQLHGSPPPPGSIGTFSGNSFIHNTTRRVSEPHVASTQQQLASIQQQQHQNSQYVASSNHLSRRDSLPNDVHHNQLTASRGTQFQSYSNNSSPSNLKDTIGLPTPYPSPVTAFQPSPLLHNQNRSLFQTPPSALQPPPPSSSSAAPHSSISTQSRTSGQYLQQSQSQDHAQQVPQQIQINNHKQSNKKRTDSNPSSTPSSSIINPNINVDIIQLQLEQQRKVEESVLLEQEKRLMLKQKEKEAEEEAIRVAANLARANAAAAAALEQEALLTKRQEEEAKVIAAEAALVAEAEAIKKQKIKEKKARLRASISSFVGQQKSGLEESRQSIKVEKERMEEKYKGLNLSEEVEEVLEKVVELVEVVEVEDVDEGFADEEKT